jgi:Fur family transcriptional regulator, iron response regulator
MRSDIAPFSPMSDVSSPSTNASEPSRRACLTAILRMSGLRPTRQRLDLANRLIGTDRHVKAEDLHAEATGSGEEISLATVYNTLRQFQSCGLVRELAFEGMSSLFDTDTSCHHHFYLTGEARIIDIPADRLAVSDLAGIPEGYEVSRVDVVVRLRRRQDEKVRPAVNGRAD